MTLDLHYRGIDVLTSSDVEAMIDRMLHAEAERDAAQAEVARLQLAATTLVGAVEALEGVEIEFSLARVLSTACVATKTALAGGPR